LSPTLWTANIPRRVIASDVMTRLYGRGLGVPLAPERPPAESAAVVAVPGAPPGALLVRAGPAPVEGDGREGGVVPRAQAASSSGTRTSILYRMRGGSGFTEFGSRRS